MAEQLQGQKELTWFLAFLSLEMGRSPATVTTYRNVLVRYLKWLQLQDLTLQQVDTALVEEFIAWRRQSLTSRSLAQTLAVLRTFHACLKAERRLPSDPAKTVKHPKLAPALPHPLSIEQVQQLLAAAQHQQPTEIAQRDTTLLELLYGTGGRVSEIVALPVAAVADLIGETGEPRLLRLVGKGNKERIVPLGSYAQKALTNYIHFSRPRLSAGRHAIATNKLLLSNRGRPLTRQQAGNLIRALGVKACLTVPISPHTLRHSFATHMLQGGADIRAVQELLGHACLNTTQIYTKVTIDTLRDVYLTSHPRAIKE